jgi:hypothetical protein
MLIFPDTVVGSILVTGDFKYEEPDQSAPTGANTVLGKKRRRAETSYQNEQHQHNRVVDPMIDSIQFWLKELRPFGGNVEPIVEEDYLSSDSKSDKDAMGDDVGEDGRSETNTEDLLLQMGRGDDALNSSTAVASPKPPDTRSLPHHTNIRAVSPPAILDHMYIDDTWLHLSTTYQSMDPHRPAPKSKLLNSAQLVKAFQSLKTTLWFQCQLEVDGRRKMVGSLERRLSTRSTASDGTTNADEETVNLSSSASAVRPFVVRVYIHNNFGKEAILASLASILGGTTVVVDDDRYALLAALTHIGSDMGVGGEGSNANMHNNLDGSPPANDSQGVNDDFSVPNPDLFLPRSVLAAKLSEWQMQRRTTTTATAIPPGCIEVVSRRAEVSEAALSQACKATRYYGLIMTGWAKSTTRTYPTLGHQQQQQSSSSSHQAASNIFEVPYSLHTSPENLIRFVRALRPRSVAAQHFKESRSAHISSVLGPYFYEPYVSLSALQVRGDIPIPVSWIKYINRAPRRADTHLHTPPPTTSTPTHIHNNGAVKPTSHTNANNNDNSDNVGDNIGGVCASVGRYWTHLSATGNTTSPPQHQPATHRPHHTHNPICCPSSSSPLLSRMALRGNEDAHTQLTQLVSFSYRRTKVGSRAVTIPPPHPDDGEDVDAAVFPNVEAVPFNMSIEPRDNTFPIAPSCEEQQIPNQIICAAVADVVPNHLPPGNDATREEDEALSYLLLTGSPSSLWEMAEDRC